MLGRRTTTIITHDIMYGQDPRARVMLSGMFRDEDIRAVNEARPDLCGFTVNWPSSRRHVDRDRLRRLVSLLDPTIPAVGVFFDQPLGFVSEVADEMLDVIQLQGTEGNAYMTFLRELADLPIIQAIRMSGPSDVERANKSTADLVLLCAGWGTGVPFDWELARQVKRPYILAGGLSVHTIPDAMERLSPWGIDMNTALETNRVKDPHKIAAAVAAVRSASA